RLEVERLDDGLALQLERHAFFASMHRTMSPTVFKPEASASEISIPKRSSSDTRRSTALTESMPYSTRRPSGLTVAASTAQACATSWQTSAVTSPILEKE